LVSARTAAGVTQYVYSLGSRPVAEYEAAWEYLLADPLGSVRQIANAEGNVTLLKSYEPYGSVLSSQGNATSVFGYAGEQVDATGLIFLRARYYQALLGLFLSRDPWDGDALRPGSMNGWNYTEGNPVNLTDPSGRSTSPWPCMWPNHLEEDPETGEWLCVGPGFGTGSVVDVSKTGVGSAVIQVLVELGLIFCAAAIREAMAFQPGITAFTEPDKFQSGVIVELGAGDYSNAKAIHNKFPGAVVYATNSIEDWTNGKFYHEHGASPTDEDAQWAKSVYEGWEDAKERGIIVSKTGSNGPLENGDIPFGIADIVYSIFPPPATGAFLFGAHAAKIAKHSPGTVTFVTSGSFTARALFVSGFQHARAPLTLFPPEFRDVPGALLGLNAPEINRWEAGEIWTSIHVTSTN